MGNVVKNENVEKVENKVMSDDFLMDSVSYMAHLPLGALLDGERNSLWELFSNNERIETSKGFVWGFNTGTTHYNKETNSIRAELAVERYDHVVEVLKDLLEKACVKSVLTIPGRASDFSYDSNYEFADGVMTRSESHNYYDNGILDSGEETFVEVTAKKLGVDLDQITFDDLEVFAALQDMEISKWCYIYRRDHGDDSLIGLMKPRSLEDMMVYYSAVMGVGYEDNRAIVEEYVARRDGLKPVPENLPEELKRTFGLPVYLEQEELSDGKEPGVAYPMPMIAARLNSEVTYKFVYLCKKYGVHKGLK